MTLSSGRGGPGVPRSVAYGDFPYARARESWPLVGPDRWWVVLLAFVVVYAAVHAGSNALRRVWFGGDFYWSMALPARVAWFACSSALAAGAQWLLLRRDFSLTSWWIVATVGGTAAVVAFLDPLLSSVAPTLARLAGEHVILFRYLIAQVGAAIYGLSIAVPQAVVLHRRGVIHAGWWCVAATAGAIACETFQVGYASMIASVRLVSWQIFLIAAFANALQGLPSALCFCLLRRKPTEDSLHTTT